MLQGRWGRQLPQKSSADEDVRAWRTARRVHRRMEEAEEQGRGWVEQTQGKAGQEEGN